MGEGTLTAWLGTSKEKGPVSPSTRLLFLCCLKLSLTGDSLCLDPKGRTPVEQSPMHSFRYLPSYPLHLFCPSFLVRKFSSWFCRELSIPGLTSLGLLVGHWCLPGELASQGQANLPLENCFCYSPIVFPKVYSMKRLVLQTWSAMTGFMVKYWGTYIPF